MNGIQVEVMKMQQTQEYLQKFFEESKGLPCGEYDPGVIGDVYEDGFSHGYSSAYREAYNKGIQDALEQIHRCLLSQVAGLLIE